MLKKFVLFGVPRVGSNYFISLLNKHPSVRCHFEVFSKDRVYLSWPDDYIDSRPELAGITNRTVRDADPIQFLDRLLAASDRPVSGFNIFPKQNDEVIDHVCSESTYSCIFIKRRNILRSYVSQKIAEKNNAWNSLKSGSLTIENKQIAIDTDNFDKYLHRVRNFYDGLMSRLDLSGRTFHTVIYEDLARGIDALAKCFEYLGLPTKDQSRESSFKKENSESIDEIVTNYSELSDYCSQHGLTSWLCS